MSCPKPGWLAREYVRRRERIPGKRNSMYKSPESLPWDKCKQICLAIKACCRGKQDLSSSLLSSPLNFPFSPSFLLPYKIETLLTTGSTVKNKYIKPIFMEVVVFWTQTKLSTLKNAREEQIGFYSYEGNLTCFGKIEGIHGRGRIFQRIGYGRWFSEVI